MTQTLAPDLTRVRTARNAVFVVFALAGVVFSSFASRIADSKAQLGLSAGQLGLTLFAASCGSVLALPFAGRVADRIGASRAVVTGMVVAAVGLVSVGLAVDVARSRPLMAAGLFLLGMGVGLWDVAMNLEGAAVERLLGRNVMPHFHAAFSGGTVVAALVGSLMSWAGVSLVPHFLGALAVSAVLGWWGVRAFLPRAAEEHTSGAGEPSAAGPAPATPRSAWLEPRTLMVGMVVLAAAFTEGTANDWIAVGFVEGHGLPAWAGVLAFAVFLSFMTLGRILGTGMLDRYGRVPVLRATFALAAVGSLMVIFGNPVLAYLGTAVWGVGASLGFPVGMSASADDPARAGARMSVVATIGYTAFIGGPPLLGFLGDHFTVLKALLVVTAMVFLAMLVIPATRESGTLTPGAPEPAGTE
ncbi:MFS transporter [Pedococcus sp. NPDC057267]|uniref:MFS transporter n=1 Tax=Pedococcus sp. NPDC057267 TaxID=3346077 RepID=UPI0036346BD6